MKRQARHPLNCCVSTISALLLLVCGTSQSKAEEKCKNMPSAGFSVIMSKLQDKLLETEAENGTRKPTDPIPDDNANRYRETLKGYITGCHAGEVIKIPDYFEDMAADLCDFSKSIYSGKSVVMCIMRAH